MKKNLEYLLTNMMFTIVLCCMPVVKIFAGEPDGFGDNVLDTPIDGGLSLLIAAGVGYGIKKVRDERKKSKEAKEGIDK